MEQYKIDKFNQRQAEFAERIAFHTSRIYELRCKKLGLPDIKERIAWHESKIQIIKDTARIYTLEHYSKMVEFSPGDNVAYNGRVYRYWGVEWNGSSVVYVLHKILPNGDIGVYPTIIYDTKHLTKI